MEEVGALWQENTVLQRSNEELVGEVELSHNKHAESLCALEIIMVEKERCKTRS